MKEERDMSRIAKEVMKRVSKEINRQQANSKTNNEKPKMQIHYDKTNMFFASTTDYIRANDEEGIYKSVFCNVVEKEFPKMDIGEVREKMFLAPISMPKEIADIPEDKLIEFYDKYRVYIWSYLQKAAEETYDSVIDYLYDLEILKNMSTEVQFVTTLARLAIAHGIITSKTKKKRRKKDAYDPLDGIPDYDDADTIDDDIIDLDDEIPF